MNANSTPAKVALQSFAICLGISLLVLALFFLFGDGAKVLDLNRIGILLFVALAVPVGNYIGAKWRHRNGR